MWRIIPHLYLGDSKDARDIMLLRACEITHIVNCACEAQCWYPSEFKYLHLPMYDPDPEFPEYVDDFCKFIRRGRKQGNVLVHCHMGRSRSPSVILAYLCRRGKSLEDALTILRRGVGESEASFIEPDPCFLEQIEDYFDLDD